MPSRLMDALLLAGGLLAIALFAGGRYASAEAGDDRARPAAPTTAQTDALRDATNEHGARTRPVERDAGGLTPTQRHAMQQRVAETFALAEEALGTGDVQRADRLLRMVIRVDPEHVRAAAMLRALYDRMHAKLPIDRDALEAALAVLGRDFVLYESRHFAVLSDCDRRWTQQRINLLEATYSEFFRTMERLGLQPIPPREKLVCILIEEHAQYDRFARTFDNVEAPWVAGYYATLPNHIVMYNDATGPSFDHADAQLRELGARADESRARLAEARRAGDADAADLLDQRVRSLDAHATAERARIERAIREAADRKAVHEAAHLVSFNSNIQLRSRQYPFWITEGVATNFETTDYRKRFGPSVESEARADAFERYRRDDQLLPLRELIVLNEIADVSAQRADVIYAQTWAFFAYAYRYQREELALYLRDLRREAAGEVTPERHLAMFTARFGDPAAVERVWLRRERGAAASR
jgi:hypothetical protein